MTNCYVKMVNAHFPVYLSDDCHLSVIVAVLVVDGWRAEVSAEQATNRSRRKKMLFQYFISKIEKCFLNSSHPLPFHANRITKPTWIFWRTRIHLNGSLSTARMALQMITLKHPYTPFLSVGHPSCHKLKYGFIIFACNAKLWHCVTKVSSQQQKEHTMTFCWQPFTVNTFDDF